MRVFELRYITPPECQGQLVTLSYALDGEDNTVYQREYDATSGRTHSRSTARGSACNGNVCPSRRRRACPRVPQPSTLHLSTGIS